MNNKHILTKYFCAQSPETFTYDADGNMLKDGRFRYYWNAENGLVKAEELYAPTSRDPYTIDYAYDHKGRMVKKVISRGGTEMLSIEYLWDGWNIIKETKTTHLTLEPFNSLSVVADNIWGLDLDGTIQGAGGVGGLLAVVRDDGTYLPTYDANGNICEYVDADDGTIAAHYEYSPFGELLIEDGELADSFTHRFSTKPYCSITKLCEYQMRKYMPEIGGWLNGDPAEEEGGVNVYAFCLNSPLLLHNYIGLDSKCDCITVMLAAKSKCNWESFWHATHKYQPISSGDVVQYSKKHKSLGMPHTDKIEWISVEVNPKPDNPRNCKCKDVWYKKTRPLVIIENSVGDITREWAWNVVPNMNGQLTFDLWVTQSVKDLIEPKQVSYDVKVSVDDETCFSSNFKIAY